MTQCKPIFTSFKNLNCPKSASILSSIQLAVQKFCNSILINNRIIITKEIKVCPIFNSTSAVVGIIFFQSCQFVIYLSSICTKLKYAIITIQETLRLNKKNV